MPRPRPASSARPTATSPTIRPPRTSSTRSPRTPARCSSAPSRKTRRAGIEQAIAVAGTPTSLAAIAQDLEPYDPARVHGYVLTATKRDEIFARLAALPLDRRREVPGLHPDRAIAILPGIVILTVAMDLFGLDAVRSRSTTSCAAPRSRTRRPADLIAPIDETLALARGVRHSQLLDVFPDICPITGAVTKGA